MAASAAVAAVAAPVNAAPIHAFSDVGPSYDEAVSFLYEYEIINGKSATQFGTYQQLTRGRSGHFSECGWGRHGIRTRRGLYGFE